MKKKEVEKFVDEVGLPLYEELTRLDRNERWTTTGKDTVEIWSPSFKKMYFRVLNKLLKRRNEKAS